jgi:hypothetical protein
VFLKRLQYAPESLTGNLSREGMHMLDVNSDVLGESTSSTPDTLPDPNTR